MAAKNTLIITESIEAKILLIRGQKIMLDADLAELYNAMKCRSRILLIKSNPAHGTVI